MAKFEVTAPDGARYEIEAPDTATDAQIAEVVKSQFAAAPAKKKSEPYQDWTSYGKDLARSALGQGTALGFGDEITAGIRSTFGSTPYKQALQEERDAVARFRDQNPIASFSGELAGGLATPLIGAAGYIGRGGNLLSRAARSGMVGAGIGATNAVGAQEGNDPATYVDSIKSGGAVGGVIGAALPIALNGASRAWQGGKTVAARARDTEESARLYLADRLMKGNVSEGMIEKDLARGAQSSQFSTGSAMLPETIADASPVTQRVLRGVKVGGAADDVIEPFLGARQAGKLDYSPGAETGGQLDRVKESTRLALNASEHTATNSVDVYKGQRKIMANGMFDAARKNSEAFDLSQTLQRYSLEAMNLPDPAQRATLNRAVKYFTQHGNSKGQSPGFPVSDIDKFHKAKMALDDQLSKKSVKEQGNLYRLLTAMKHDLMGDAFRLDAKGTPTANKLYKDALDKYSSTSAIINAEDVGKGIARGEKISERQWQAMPLAEQRMARRAWLDATMQKPGGKPAGPTSDFTGPLRTENAQQDLRMMLPRGDDNGARLADLVGREQRMSQTANKVLGNSSTAEKAVDTIDLNKLSQVSRYIRDNGGITQAIISGIADKVEKLTAIKGEKARYLATQLLETDKVKQAAFLRQVADEYGEHQAQLLAKSVNNWTAQIESAIIGAPARAQGERATAETKRANAPRGLIGLGSATR